MRCAAIDCFCCPSTESATGLGSALAGTVAPCCTTRSDSVAAGCFGSQMIVKLSRTPGSLLAAKMPPTRRVTCPALSIVFAKTNGAVALICRGASARPEPALSASRAAQTQENHTRGDLNTDFIQLLSGIHRTALGLRKSGRRLKVKADAASPLNW